MHLLSDIQKRTCSKFGADYLRCDENLKFGINKNFNVREFPINGLRHPPEGDTTGWYIWSGEKFSEVPGFFVPMHTSHLHDLCPVMMRYLGLAPGWRFLLAPDYEDVWFHPNLLNI